MIYTKMHDLIKIAPPLKFREKIKTKKKVKICREKCTENDPNKTNLFNSKINYLFKI